MSAVMNHPAQVSEYAVLGFSGVQLALPQREVVSIDLVTDIDTSAATGNRLGTLLKSAQQWSVYTLSDSFDVLHQISDEQRFCVSFGSGRDDDSFALTCELAEAVVLDNAGIVQPLPESILMPAMPMQHCFRNGKGLVLVSDQRGIQDYLLALDKVNG